LLHFALRFGAFYLAFWCILHRVLVHFASRFGAFCIAFWCVLPQIMLQKALKGAQIVCLNNVQWLFVHLYAHPVLYPNKLAQYSQKIERAEDWLEKMQP